MERGGPPVGLRAKRARSAPQRLAPCGHSCWRKGGGRERPTGPRCSGDVSPPHLHLDSRPLSTAPHGRHGPRCKSPEAEAPSLPIPHQRPRAHPFPSRVLIRARCGLEPQDRLHPPFCFAAIPPPSPLQLSKPPGAPLPTPLLMQRTEPPWTIHRGHGVRPAARGQDATFRWHNMCPAPPPPQSLNPSRSVEAEIVLNEKGPGFICFLLQPLSPPVYRHAVTSDNNAQRQQMLMSFLCSPHNKSIKTTSENYEPP